MKNIYLDNAATTKVKEEVIKKMMPYFSEEYGNPSAIYSIARKSKRAIEDARKQVADFIGAEKNEIYFTGCGSESDNMAIKGIAYANRHKGNHIITSKIEHHAVLETCEFLEKQGFDITYLNVDETGKINLNELKNSITDKTILISIMFANNEIGTIEPIKEIAQIAHENNIILHTDAVQAVGNIKINVKEMGIDLLSMSGHKIYAPKGIGAIYIRNGINIEKFMNGGAQERNKRAGTENVASIVGLCEACKIAKNNLNEHIEKLRTLRDYYEKRVQENIKNIKINGNIENRLPGTSNISFKDIDGGMLLFELDSKGICVSSGSACSSGSHAPSHVLTAIGLKNEWSRGTIRITFGDFNNKEEIDYLINELVKIIEKFTKNNI